jgi:prephenate dehydrogenase
MPRLAIIGLGLIGGSIGLALKRAKLGSLEIAGSDAEWDVATRARRAHAIDRDVRSAVEAVEGAAVVVVAVPISQMPKVFEEIAPALGEGAVVTDTASTKREVLRWAQELLPASVSFVGGHPIAGKETPGLDAAEASLFEGRPWALCPSVHASEKAIQTIENLIAVAGARPVLIDAAEHDSYLAAVSHLPLVAASALFSVASSGKAWPELAGLAGPGFRDTTRLASTSPDLSHDICLTNRENVLHWLDRYREELRRFRDLIADAATQEQFVEAFAKVQAARDAFLEAPPPRPGPTTDIDIPSAGDRMLSFMIGEYAARRAKEVQQMVERMESGDKRGGR